MWGFCHSTLTTEPLSMTFFASSNSAAKEWWASMGTAAATRSPAIVRTIFVFMETSRTGHPGPGSYQYILFVFPDSGERYHAGPGVSSRRPLSRFGLPDGRGPVEKLSLGRGAYQPP